MSTPPPDGPSSSQPDSERWASADPTAAPPEPVSLDKPDPPFDPYRFGAPEHPVPPEYAPPGYTPPPVASSGPPAQSSPGYPGAGNPAAGYGGPSYGSPGYGGPGYGGPAYPGPGYAPPPYAQQYPQPRTGNGKATAALVLGILAIVFCWTSVFDIVLVVLAVIFGFLGLGEAKQGRAGGRGMAITGLICALVGALLAVAVSVVIYSRIRPCLNSYDRNSSAYNNCVRDRF